MSLPCLQRSIILARLGAAAPRVRSRPASRLAAAGIAQSDCQLPRLRHASAAPSAGRPIARAYTAATVSDPAVKPPPSPTGKTVTLDFESYHPKQGADATGVQAAGPIVICHGLFGSKQNWRSLGRAMASRFGVDVYALDLRNHGTSPHIDGLHYRDMAADIERFLEEKQLDKIILIGHSMGGKVVMSTVLDDKIGKRVDKLVSVDMSPRRGPLSKEFEQYMDGMVEIEEAKVATRHEADQLLQKIEPDLGVRQFLLTNLTRNPPDAASWSWRIPVRLMQKNISSIGDFPYDPPEVAGSETQQHGSGQQQHYETRSWNGDVLFVKGAKSKYINRRNVPTNRAYFPNSKMVVMDTGHWCQAEKPNEFVKVVEDFVRGTTVDETDEVLKPRSAGA